MTDTMTPESGLPPTGGSKPPSPNTVLGHSRALLLLGLPMIGGHVAQFSIGLTDTVMLGWYGVAELAAVTLGSTYFFSIFLLGSGFAFAVMPMVAAAAGSGEERQIRRTTRMGLWLSLIYGALAVPLLWWSEPILLFLGQNQEVAHGAAEYLRIAGWAIFPALLYMVVKSYLAALERTQAVLWFSVFAALINGVVNYALIFGNWGAPELGVTGAAIASLVTNFISFGLVIGYALRILPEHELLKNALRPDWEMMRRVLRMGTPIGLTTVAESSLFAASAMMMGWIGTVALAAHGIAISLAGITFMVHLGLSNAATVRAGNAYGRRDRDHLARGARVVMAMSLAMSAIGIVLMLTIPEPLIALFLDGDDPEKPQILALGVGLLAAAALFQLMDGMQVVALGLLRGVQDTAWPMVIAVLSYWAVGIPVSYLFGFVFGWGGIGVWFGLVIGLSAAGILLMARFWMRSIKTVGSGTVG